MTSSGSRRPLAFTFGNHMHWVDMQWLWGYGVLPGSVRDMLTLCGEARVRGNVNFDGVGYERMASECPETLAALRAAVADGRVEPVGCSYGQPYGLFQGGESNVRQLTFGARSVRRLLGVWPKAFWEEEFYFFPQLPQMLRSAGFDSACLFFQWTWHTPEMPRENASVISWEGIDGTTLPALPRNELNVHQWPEDFDGILESPMLKEAGGRTPAVVQWLELMPTKDWMCRSEVLLPRLKELLGDARFEVKPGTVSTVVRDLLASSAEAPPVRRYTMDDVWHGMTAGKNSDMMPRRCAEIEQLIQSAEAAATLAGYFGRPYPSWDVYPAWELDEAWRELLAAQHHDNHECEGLCGFVGHFSLDRAKSLAREVQARSISSICSFKHLGSPDEPNKLAVFNPLPWAATLDVGSGQLAHDVPPLGYAVVGEGSTRLRDAGFVDAVKDAKQIKLVRGGLWVTVDRKTGTIVQAGADGLEYALDPKHPMLNFTMTRGGRQVRFENATVTVEEHENEDPRLIIVRKSADGDEIHVEVSLAPEAEAIDVVLVLQSITDPVPPDGGLNAALQMEIVPSFSIGEVIADTPYAMDAVKADGVWKRKYPKGDWMTSPQWFEEVRRPFTSLRVVDLIDTKAGRKGPRGVMIAHDSVLQWFRDDRGVRCVLSAYDPWDEDKYALDQEEIRLRLIPHGPMTHADRAKAAIAHLGRAEIVELATASVPGNPPAFGLVDASGADGVIVHGVWRENPKNGEYLDDWAGHELRRRSAGTCGHPLGVRLVEWNGKAAAVTLTLPGKVEHAAKTDILGRVVGWLDVTHPAPPPAWASRNDTLRGQPLTWSSVRVEMRPREVATVMADVVEARKQWRDLDAKREVWATVHREPAGG